MLQFILLFLSGVIAPECMAQVPAKPGPKPIAVQKREFEIAAVREDKSGGKQTSNFPLDRGKVYFPTGGSLMATNQSVVTLLIFAYKINISEFRGGLMRRLPSWATTARFDVNARSESKEASKEDMRLMMQSLLEDRFK
jgi:bla regulator protein BlaR1